jgi:hypothetical protein
VSIYSTLLYSGDAPSGLTNAYTVPANQVVVVRDLELYNSTGASIALSVSRSVSGVTQSYVYVTAGLAAHTWQQWTGRAVLDAGDVLQVSTGAAGVYFHVSGYLLS